MFQIGVDIYLLEKHVQNPEITQSIANIPYFALVAVFAGWSSVAIGETIIRLEEK